MPTKIFISHKQSEENIAGLLVEFLTSALDIRDDQIRCTSVPGYQLPFGRTIAQQLKEDIKTSSVVFVLVTPDSIRSMWVLFELGASWALGKILIPILAPGLNFSDLPDPLTQLPCVPIDASDASSRLMDCIDSISKSINVKEKSGGKIQAKLDDFVTTFKLLGNNSIITEINPIYDRFNDIPWKDLISKSSQIDIIVQYFDSWIHNWAENLKSFFIQGGKVRIILPNYENIAIIRQITTRFPEYSTKQVQDKIAMTFPKLHLLCKKSHHNGASVDAYYVDHMIWYCGVKFDHKALIISPYEHYRETHVSSPATYVSLNQHDRIFDWFNSEINELTEKSIRKQNFII